MSKSDSQKTRCGWLNSDPLYIQYHDEEWGVPLYDDQKLFEFIVLESSQAGLSWYTVLRKRENYRAAFANFKPEEVAKFGEQDLDTLMKNPGIIRNRQKISAAITNARAFMAIQDEFGSFARYSWTFVGGRPIQNLWKDLKNIPATSLISDCLSKDLKKRGFKFIGSTIIYAHMQAVGMVNDHTVNCFRHQEVMYIPS